MAEDFYSQSEDSQEPDDSSPEKQESGESNTTLVAASFFGDKDLSVGSTCEVKIVRVYGDEVEVELVPHQYEDKQTTTKDADSMIDEMASETS